MVGHFMETRLINRNITATRGRSSMRLEPEIWLALQEICLRERVGIADLVQRVEATLTVGGRTSAVRVFAFEYFRAAATEAGHEAAGHGALNAGN